MRAQQAVDQAKDEFDHVGARVTREMNRFKREKAVDMRKIVTDYVNLQIEFSQRVEQAWRGLVPDLEAIQVDGGDAAVGAGGYVPAAASAPPSVGGAAFGSNGGAVGGVASPDSSAAEPGLGSDDLVGV